MVFSNNVGQELNGTRQGAAYTNDEAVFKSRTLGQDNGTDGGIDDQGPFGSGSRSRNAQRLAARNVDAGGTKLEPDLTIGASDFFLFPGLGESTFRVQQPVANVFGAGNGFFFDDFTRDGAGNNLIYDSFFEATGVGGGGIGGGNGGPRGIDTMPWGWSILP